MRAARRTMALLGRIALAAVLVTAAGAAPAGARTIGEIVDDARITAEVTTKLAADKLSNLTRVNVKSDTGIVTLSGTVDSSERGEKAAQIASGVTGVKEVVNNIHVKGSGTAASQSTPSSTPAPAPS